MKIFVRFSLTLILLFTLSGCDILEVVNELRGTPTPDTKTNVLFYDEFSSPFSGWDIDTGDDGQTVYIEGGYLIWVKQPNLDLWANPGLDLKDVSIEVDAARVDGPLSNTYGLICRYQDVDHFYFGIVGSDGYYAIGKRFDGVNILLSGEKLQPTNKVADGTTVNHLRFDCNGSRLDLYANGYLLAHVEDEDFLQGDVGVIAGTLEESGVAVTFDNFAVFAPPASTDTP